MIIFGMGVCPTQTIDMKTGCHVWSLSQTGSNTVSSHFLKEENVPAFPIYIYIYLTCSSSEVIQFHQGLSDILIFLFFLKKNLVFVFELSSSRFP